MAPLSNSPDRLHDRPDRRAVQRELRQHLTTAEATLWRVLSRKQLGGFKFRRQHSIGPYVVDFYCAKARLLVELDGAGHFTPSGILADEIRTRYFTQLGFRVLRFENEQVWACEKILEAVLAACQEQVDPE